MAQLNDRAHFDHERSCICDILEEIQSFRSILEFHQFEKYLNRILVNAELVEVPVEKYYANFDEQWFTCAKCKVTWRLVHPDFPFRGLFQEIRRM